MTQQTFLVKSARKSCRRRLFAHWQKPLLPTLPLSWTTLAWNMAK
ncbi:Uncharacterised protein [Serratia fonticola]|uniref:Uncharacterized protein n=1 Tax=Serratia fonticola TaxID=47917 RepID=A0A4U9WGN5_SERFO|nr:Uncharacterised protein [Serratia fonticola]